MNRFDHLWIEKYLFNVVVVVVVELVLYVHGEQLKSCRDGHMVLSTLFLGKPPRGRLPVLSAHHFAIH